MSYTGTVTGPYTMPSGSGVDAIAVFLADVAPVCGVNHTTGAVFYRLSTGNDKIY